MHREGSQNFREKFSRSQEEVRHKIIIAAKSEGVEVPHELLDSLAQYVWIWVGRS
jgi:hypothetical protein